ncbi:MAG: hypothetical protein FD153_969 [Rhodospirillaceae bacterium]|nr:MAG: hypothetical protein FD153_969 [Rhodospirillaceae bacterium]
MSRSAAAADTRGGTRMKGMARGAFLRVVMAIAPGSVMMVGCTSVPDTFNPVAGYQEMNDWLRGTESKADANSDATIRAAQEQADHEPFPDINTVPDRVPPVTSATRRRAIMEALVADRTSARHGTRHPLPDPVPRSPHMAEPLTDASSPVVPSPTQSSPGQAGTRSGHTPSLQSPPARAATVVPASPPVY